ncbi:MAG: endo-1,4-beta-xylanase [Armatimonadota bacterium]
MKAFHTIITAIILLTILSMGYCALPVESFEASDSIKAWGFYNGPEFPGAKGEVTLSARSAHSGKQGLAFSFDFTGGGNYVQAGRPILAGEKVTSLRLWIRNPGMNSLGLRVTDGEGQTFQKTFAVPHGGWQQIEISFSGWTGNWGGKGDAVFRGSPVLFAILVENNAAAKKGVIDIDDIRFITSGQASGIEDTEYYVCKFNEKQQWYLVSGYDDTSGSRYYNGVFSFDFSKDAKDIGITSDLAIMGTAKSLKLRVGCPTPGITLKMTISSHFQDFKRVIGETDGTDDQVIEVPLGDMSSWKYSGGENDGQVRWPLRLTFLGVDREGNPSKGEIRLIDIVAKSQLPLKSAVVMLPSGRIDGDKARFSCEITNILPEKVSGTLEYNIKDFQGAVLASSKGPLTILKDDTFHFETQIDAAEHGFVECEFYFRTKVYTYGPVYGSAVKPIPDEGSRALEPDSIFGMGVYLYRYPTDAEGRKWMTKAAEIAMAAGVKWSREEMMWAAIEPECGKFDWSRYDAVVDTALSHGISVYGLIDYWSEWTKPYTPEGISDYVNYCKALVGRYKGKIKHWEIWNEPNIFFWPGPKEVYPQLLKAAYNAIKEVDPDAQVLGCSTAGIDSSFIKMVMDAGAPFDILTIHPYRYALDDEQFIKELQDVHKLTEQMDGKPRPVWITEMGWATDIPNGITERQQASLLARSYLCTAASQTAENVSWYDFRDDGGSPFYNEHRFGVVRSYDFTPKPAYRALASVCRTLTGQKLAGKIDLGAGIMAYKFAGGGRETVAIWARRRTAVLRLKVDGTDLTMRDLMYQDTKLPLSEKSMLLVAYEDIPVFITGKSVDVSSQSKPIYIEADDAVQIGGSFYAALKSEGSLVDTRLTIEAPAGWKVASGSDTSVKLKVPSTEQSGMRQLSLKLTFGSKQYLIPIQAEVMPSVMEF